MRSAVFFLLLALASARGLYACCAYELEGGGCDIDLCPGECIIVGDECPDRINNGCFLQSSYGLGDAGCEECACDPFGDRSRGVATGANKYGSLKIGAQILAARPPKKGGPKKDRNDL
jgi:hypothetical protein